jgi:hypothetical protein
MIFLVSHSVNESVKLHIYQPPRLPAVISDQMLPGLSTHGAGQHKMITRTFKEGNIVKTTCLMQLPDKCARQSHASPLLIGVETQLSASWIGSPAGPFRAKHE